MIPGMPATVEVNGVPVPVPVDCVVVKLPVPLTPPQALKKLSTHELFNELSKRYFAVHNRAVDLVKVTREAADARECECHESTNRPCLKCRISDAANSLEETL